MIEAERYRRAWAWRRQRYWIFYAAMAVSIALLFGQTGPSLFAGFFGIIGTVAWFYRFRCPRCGALFTNDWPTVWTYKDICQHCGLKIDEIPGETR